MSVLEQDTVALSDGDAGCDVVPQGGAVAGFWWGQGSRRIDWLKRASATAVRSGSAREMACYPSVPWGNRIRDGRFRFGSREVIAADADADADAAGPHAPDGHGWRRTWRVAERSGARVVLDYEHAPGAWPWRYRARQTVALEAAASA